MEKYGMGFCYENSFDGTKIKAVTSELLEKTREYYEKHHEKMNSVAITHLHLLLFDLHSYSDDIVPKAFLSLSKPTPDICIGTDPRYTPRALTDTLERHFVRENISYAENYPYRGCFVPNVVLKSGRRRDFTGIMIEVNKRFYCDRNGDAIEGRLLQLRQILEKVLVESIGQV